MRRAIIVYVISLATIPFPTTQVDTCDIFPCALLFERPPLSIAEISDLFARADVLEAIAEYTGVSPNKALQVAVEPVITGRGHGRETFRLNLEIGDSGSPQKHSLALKVAEPNSKNHLNLEQLREELAITRHFRAEPLFLKHFSQTLWVGESASKNPIQLDTWKEGRLLNQIFYDLAYEVAEGKQAETDALVAVFKNTVKTARFCFNTLKRGDSGLLFDLGLDDILIGSDNLPIFVDADGGRRCGKSSELRETLTDFRHDIFLKYGEPLGGDCWQLMKEELEVAA